jgi:hypothetical protein
MRGGSRNFMKIGIITQSGIATIPPGGNPKFVKCWAGSGGNPESDYSIRGDS